MYIRITLNNRADTAAPAMVNRMTIRSRPLVFLLRLPRRNGSRGVEAAIMAKKGQKTSLEQRKERRWIYGGLVILKSVKSTAQRRAVEEVNAA